ncbi:MAG: LysR family transcriptional regulator, partial [Betaproteobacteria bacterium]|nr:LysR family transcriptional regulator [Betaproteobacteria bacterium]
MPANARDLLTPDALSMLLAIEETGSFAAAARELGLVPSALTYRVRQIEDALDVLLFDRSSRQAKPTEAGKALLREAQRMLQDVDAIANRVKRVATGWESVFTVAVAHQAMPWQSTDTDGNAVAPEPDAPKLTVRNCCTLA